MKPDKLDIKIQEAAAQNEPAYSEEAWTAMEKLLDEKMPQQKKDNRKIFWLILFLFIIAGGALLVMWPGGNKTNRIVSVKNDQPKVRAESNDSVLISQKKDDKKNINEGDISASVFRKTEIKKSPIPQTILNSKNEISENNKIDDKKNDEPIFSPEKDAENKIKPEEPELVISEKNDALEKENPSVSIESNHKDSTTEIKKEIADTTNNLATKKTDKDISPKKSKKSAPPRKFSNAFAVQLSIGADASGVSINKIGKLKPVFGAGASYKLNNKFTVRTGFYVSRKIYEANPSEYNPPSGFWNYYPNLKNIDADCKIYEVPLIINYNFSNQKNQQWFVSAGVSSYFMKTEDYGYFSKSPSGQVSYNTYHLQNKNQHYFASLRFSAGYEKKLSNSISVIAEPYINLPLKGIGYGKVKLYNAGVLVSLSVKPFQKK